MRNTFTLSSFLLLFCLVTQLFSQEKKVTDSIESIDSKYREDQFYIGATYNVLLNKPENALTRGLTGSIHFGYLRDMPINKRRNIAIAAGLGVSFDEYGQTLFIGENENEQTIFTVLDEEDVDFDRNRFSTASLELPIEFRWRSSTAETYKFWRIHAGLRIAYTYWYKAAFKQPGNNVNQTEIPEFQDVRLGATLSFGYNSVNFYGYYGLTPFFKNAITTNGEPVDIVPFKLGLIFYIL